MPIGQQILDSVHSKGVRPKINCYGSPRLTGTETVSLSVYSFIFSCKASCVSRSSLRMSAIVRPWYSSCQHQAWRCARNIVFRKPTATSWLKGRQFCVCCLSLKDCRVSVYFVLLVELNIGYLFILYCYK